jgi:hypothetical protein
LTSYLHGDPGARFPVNSRSKVTYVFLSNHILPTYKAHRSVLNMDILSTLDDLHGPFLLCRKVPYHVHNGPPLMLIRS